MQLDRDSIKTAIRSKVIELAKALNIEASALGDADIIPATGYLDSSSILELVVWYEHTYDLALRQDEINIDNLGSVNAMADFLLARRKG
jgi:acyl carrier protein